MPVITLQVPDELAELIRNRQDRLPEILDRGLRGLDAEGLRGYEGAAEVLEFLARLPGPEEILRLRPSERLAVRVRELLERARDGQLNAKEQAEWEGYEYLEHLVRMAKASAQAKLKIAPGV